MSATLPVYCDITELLANPIRTGIQRVVREVLRNWSSGRRLQLCRFDSARLCLVEVPQEAIYYLIEPDHLTRGMSIEELTTRLTDLMVAAGGREIPLGSTILVPELFFDADRCRHYLYRIQHDADRIFILFFDFIPWLHPEAIGVEQAGPLMWYLRVAQSVQQAAFISDATYRQWGERIVRDTSRHGVVLPLGADGLSLPKQSFSSEKRNFVTLGSVDGRKNQKSILAAFEILWNEGLDVSLTLVGRIFESEAECAALIASLSSNPRFRHFKHASDQDIAEILGGARATIYASALEGFGLPPVESLATGIPCIAGRYIPSLEFVPGGIIELETGTPHEIAAKVRLMADDDAAKKKWEEAQELNLPTWAQFGVALVSWIEGQH